MVSKHLRGHQVRRGLRHGKAMFAVATKNMGWLVHQWGWLDGHLKARMHLVHGRRRVAVEAVDAVSVAMVITGSEVDGRKLRDPCGYQFSGEVMFEAAGDRSENVAAQQGILHMLLLPYPLQAVESGPGCPGAPEVGA